MTDTEAEIAELKEENRALRARVAAFDAQLANARMHGRFCHDAMTSLLEAQGQDAFFEALARRLIDATACDEVALLNVKGDCRRWNRAGALDSTHACGEPCPLVCLGRKDDDADLQEFPDLHHDERVTVPPTCPTKSVLSCRISLNGEFWGLLALLYHKSTHAFSDADRHILVSATHVVSMCEHGEMRTRFHESEVLLRARAIEKTPLSIYIKDADNDFRYLEVNEFTCQRMGMARDRFIGRNDMELFPPDVAAAYLGVDRRAMEHDGVTHIQQTYVDPSGVKRPVSSVRYPVTMPDGRRILICYSVEIAEFLEKQREIEELQRRTAEERDRAVQAEETDAFVARLLKNVSMFSEEDPMNFVLSEIGRFVGADRSYVYYFTESGRSYVCSNVYEWCAKGIRPEIEGQQNCDMGLLPDFQEAIISGRDFSFTDISRIHPGSRSWLGAQGIQSLIATPLKDQQGAIIGFVGFDFVARRIEKFDWRIVHAVHETSDIISICRSRREFYLAMRSAEKAQADFFASVSHDIRTPLNSIIGFSELLKDERDPAVRDEYLERIAFSGNTLLALINDVLDLSRLDAGAPSFRCVPVDFPRTLKLVAGTFESVLREKGVELRMDIGDMPMLMLDENRARQVFFNLVGNAAKYTDAGHIALSARFTPGADGHGVLKVSVADTGIGIAPEDVSKLMRPYVRIQSSTESRGGTGLGLSICKRIVEACGGKITIDSELGKGATFTLTLPKVEYRTDPAVASAPEPSALESRDLSELGVLVVDDLEMNRRVLCANCRKLGVGTVLEADSGQAALDMLDGTVGLVLCDMKMPGMDGAEFIRALRERPAFAELPIVLVTADVEARKYGFDMGAADVLLKPVVQDDLLHALMFTRKRSASA